MSAVLKLVQAEAFTEQLELPADAASIGGHSLQGGFQYCSPWKPSLAQYVIQRFSKKGAVVLDPLCSTGHVGVEALLAGRHFVGCTEEHGLVKLAQARLAPADLAEVALRLQFVPFKRPVDIRGYSGPFPHFFDADTFRELMNLKASLRSSRDGASEFIVFIVASILHGHTTGHLSAYSSPSECLVPEAQMALNRKRGEVPSYRAVSARILKKAAGLLRDGVPSALASTDKLRREVFFAPAHAVDRVETSSVDLAMVAPNQPGIFEHGISSWLRSWWLGADLPESSQGVRDAAEWRDSTNEVLVEMARVVKSGGRVVVRTGQGRIGSKVVHYNREVESLVRECLPRFWRIEGSISERVVDGARSRTEGNASRSSELVILRRN
jgi:SAM-dependent methyltransferase